MTQKVTSLTIARVAFANSIGFSASTAVPLWLGDISAYLGISPWFGGLVATLQLAACAVMNFSSPFLFRTIHPLALGRRALLVAALGSMVATVHSAAFFLIGCILAGGGLGVVLNATNGVAAGFESVHRAYAVFMLTEVCFGASLFLVASLGSQHFGIPAIFVLTSLVAILGFLSLTKLRVATVASAPLEGSTRSEHIVKATLALAALTVFFIGQSTVNAFIIPIGREIGLSTASVSQYIVFGMYSSFAGAIGARLLGERLGVVFPVVAVAVLLATIFLLLTNAGSPMIFAIGAIILSCCTIFVVPYFFTGLAKLDRAGRYVSVAPAFLLSGVAMGPTIAVYTSTHFGLRGLGIVASVGVSLGGSIYAVSQAMTAPRVGSVEPSYEVKGE